MLSPMGLTPSPPGLTRLLYTPAEAAEVLGFSRSRLYRLLATGEIESVQVGGVRRVPADALVSYVGALRDTRASGGPSNAA